MSGIDLSGHWTGMYHYPAHLPPNTFEATIRDNGGLVSGVIVQPTERFEPPNQLQHSVIEGSHDGSTLSFIKVYDDLERVTVHYHGMILGEGEEVEGQWTIPGDWSGTFFMVRSPEAEEVVSEKISEEIGR
jgi:hypothetical protein